VSRVAVAYHKGTHGAH